MTIVIFNRKCAAGLDHLMDVGCVSELVNLLLSLEFLFRVTRTNFLVGIN